MLSSHPALPLPNHTVPHAISILHPPLHQAECLTNLQGLLSALGKHPTLLREILESHSAEVPFPSSPAHPLRARRSAHLAPSQALNSRSVPSAKTKFPNSSAQGGLFRHVLKSHGNVNHGHPTLYGPCLSNCPALWTMIHNAFGWESAEFHSPPLQAFSVLLNSPAPEPTLIIQDLLDMLHL